MTRVIITVTLDTNDHTFVQTLSEARAVVQNILERDPRYHTSHMVVGVGNGRTVHDSVNDNAGDELHNIFEEFRNHGNGDNLGRKQFPTGT